MGEILDRKCVIRIFSEYLALGRKSSKMIITREQGPEGMNYFQVYHISLRSIYNQKMGSK